MSIKELRNKYRITAEEASITCGVPLRTFQRYEKDEQYGSALKRIAIENLLINKYEITEDKGVLSINDIKTKCEKVFHQYEDRVSFCYLFGSYAKGYAVETSDIDLFISTELTGFEFLGLIEDLRKELYKRIDLLRLADQKDNIELLSEILKDGIRIYG